MLRFELRKLGLAIATRPGQLENLITLCVSRTIAGGLFQLLHRIRPELLEHARVDLYLCECHERGHKDLDLRHILRYRE
jgi:hypothetical protein